MKQLPALKTVFFLSAGISSAYWLNPNILFLIVASLFLILISTFTLKRVVSDITITLLLLLTGAVIYSTSKPLEFSKSIRVIITGRITQPPVFDEDKLSFALRMESVTSGETLRITTNKKVWVKATGLNIYVQEGGFYQIEGVLSGLKQRRNPGDFDIKSWRERNGYIGILRADNGHIIPSNVPFFYKLRRAIHDRIRFLFPHDQHLISALTTGFRRSVDPGLQENLRKTGLSHLLALSGLHVGFLIGIFFTIGSLFRLIPRYRGLFSILLIVLFLLIVPARASTIRASVMAIVLLCGLVFRIWAPALNSLGVAAITILAFRPGDLFDVGFQLSFAAVGGIICFRYIWDVNRLPAYFRGTPFRRITARYIVRPFIISLVASTAVMPLTSYHFSTMSVGAPVFNLFAIPLMAFIFCGAWVALGLSIVWNFGAVLASQAVSGAIMVFTSFAQYAALIAPQVVWHLSPLSVVLLLLLLFSFAFSRKSIRNRFILTFLSVSAIICFETVKPGNIDFQVWFLDVGHGDATIWRFPDGRIAIIDGGPAGRTGQNNTMVKVLKYMNCKQVDLLVASHPEADHIGGLAEVVETFDIGVALATSTYATSQTFIYLLEVSNEEKVHWWVVKVGEAISGLSEGYSLTVLGPPATSSGWSSNDNSVVLMLKVYNDNDEDWLTLLMTGDIESRGEEALLANYNLQAQLLKVPHHGSATSSSPEFINAVSPELVVITRPSAQERGKYEYDMEILNRYRDSGAQVHLTGKDGALLFMQANDNDDARGWVMVDWRKPKFMKWLLGIV